MTRKCKIDIRLSNGIILPKGTHVGVAAGANALDEKYFDKPNEFDGFRFEKLMSLPGNDNLSSSSQPNAQSHLSSSQPTTKTNYTGASAHTRVLAASLRATKSSCCSHRYC